MRRTKTLPWLLSPAFALCISSSWPLLAWAGPSAPLDYAADLTFQVEALDESPVSQSRSFQASVSGIDKAFVMPVGVLDAELGVAAGQALVQSASLDVQNDVGTLGSNGGSMPLNGSLVLRYLDPAFAPFGDVTIPLGNALGAGGTAMFTTSRFDDQWQFRVEGARWQADVANLTAFVGTVSGGGVNITASTALGSLAGSDSRTASGGEGTLRLIAPMRVTAIRTNGGSGSFVQVPVTGGLLIPEPGLLALQLTAAGLLVALGRTRHR